VSTADLTDRAMMHSTVEQAGLPAGLEREAGRAAPRVGDMPLRRIPAIPAHLPVAGARQVAALKRTGILLVEVDDRIVGSVEASVLDAADGEAQTGKVMRPLGVCLRPAMSLAEARDVFARARATVLPVVAGGFVLGALARVDAERARS